MRGVYWKKRPQAGDGTVWTAAALKTAAAATAFSQAELEEAFGTRQPQKSASSRSVAVAQRGDHIALLDPRRAQNAGIALKSAGLPALGGPLRAALLAMDSAALGPARCEVLLSVAPTAEEVELLRSYDGDVGMLGMTERYFLELASVPKLMPRLRVCVGRKQLPAQAEERLASLHTLRQGLGQLRDSAALHAVLGSLLALGNALNAGTARAGAAGFSLEASLAQVCEVRCNGAPGSLLGFVALQEEKARPDAEVVVEADCYLSVLRQFVSEAEAQMSLVGEAEASFTTEAEACAAFFGEAASVSTALALLKQLDSFVTQLQAAHETNLKAEAAAQRKKQMAERQTERQMTLKPQPPSPSPAGGTPKASAARAMTPRGTPKFEECASALRSILESGGENEGGQCAPVAGGLKLRKMASSEQQRGAKESSQAAQAAELQALFLRRQSGMGMKAGNKRPV